MHKTDKAQALTDIVLAVFRINGALLANGDRRVKPYGLTGSQYQVLGAIGFHDTPVSAPQIAKFIGITRQGVQKQLKFLRDKDYILCCANPHHERSPLYSLNEKGRAQYEVICYSHDSLTNELSTQFDMSDLKVALEVLHHFYDRLMMENAVLTDCSEE